MYDTDIYYQAAPTPIFEGLAELSPLLPGLCMLYLCPPPCGPALGGEERHIDLLCFPVPHTLSSVIVCYFWKYMQISIQNNNRVRIQLYSIKFAYSSSVFQVPLLVGVSSTGILAFQIIFVPKFMEILKFREEGYCFSSLYCTYIYIVKLWKINQTLLNGFVFFNTNSLQTWCVSAWWTVWWRMLVRPPWPRTARSVSWRYSTSFPGTSSRCYFVWVFIDSWALEGLLEAQCHSPSRHIIMLFENRAITWGAGCNLI